MRISHFVFLILLTSWVFGAENILSPDENLLPLASPAAVVGRELLEFESSVVLVPEQGGAIDEQRDASVDLDETLIEEVGDFSKIDEFEQKLMIDEVLLDSGDEEEKPKLKFKKKLSQQQDTWDHLEDIDNPLSMGEEPVKVEDALVDKKPLELDVPMEEIQNLNL